MRPSPAQRARTLERGEPGRRADRERGGDQAAAARDQAPAQPGAGRGSGAGAAAGRRSARGRARVRSSPTKRPASSGSSEHQQRQRVAEQLLGDRPARLRASATHAAPAKTAIRR